MIREDGNTILVRTFTGDMVPFELSGRNQVSTANAKADEALDITPRELSHLLTKAAMYGNKNAAASVGVEPVKTIEEVKRRNEAAGGFFFSAATMKFFKSKLDSHVFMAPEKAVSFFVTSELPPNGSRVYSVRQIDWQTGRITTPLAQEGQHSTLEEARRQAKAHAQADAGPSRKPESGMTL